MKLQSHNSQWQSIFNSEKELLLGLFQDQSSIIEHIGSTSIIGIKSKPIIDIAILFSDFQDPEHYLSKFSSIGYKYSPERSSSERHFFIKDKPIQFHLSIANPGTLFLHRQIVFRDYLNSHPQLAQEYEELKVELTSKYPSGQGEYSNGKNEFVKKVLDLAK